MDNAEAVKDIERRVHWLPSVPASPMREDDQAEKTRRGKLQRFVFVEIHAVLLTPTSESSRELLRSLGNCLNNMPCLDFYAMTIVPKR